MKHPLPVIFQEEIRRVGQFRTLRKELYHDFSSTLFRDSNRAILRLVFTLHPRHKNYGGTLVFMEGSHARIAWVREARIVVAQGLWNALAKFRLVNFGLVIHKMEIATSGDAPPLLIELGTRALREAMTKAEIESHTLPGWQKPIKEAKDEAEKGLGNF
jgi:hypothetical protein